jgi:hypothetical protein
MIESMDMDHIHGKMVACISVNGKMENNMDKEFTDNLMERKGRDSGKMARELSG